MLVRIAGQPAVVLFNSSMSHCNTAEAILVIPQRLTESTHLNAVSNRPGN